MKPSLENVILLFWLKLIQKDLPRLVKQRYGTELRSQTLASMKSEISQALQSLLDELRSAEDARIMRIMRSASFYSLSRRQQRGPVQPYRGLFRWARVGVHYFRASYAKRLVVSLARHFLSKFPHPPAVHKRFFTEARTIAAPRVGK